MVLPRCDGENLSAGSAWEPGPGSDPDRDQFLLFNEA